MLRRRPIAVSSVLALLIALAVSTPAGAGDARAPSPPTVQSSHASLRVSARSVVGHDVVKSRQASSFQEFTPPALTQGASGPEGHASTQGSTSVIIGTDGPIRGVHILGSLKTSVTCTKPPCGGEPGDVSSDGKAKVSMHFQVSGTVPYILDANLVTTSTSPGACAGITVTLGSVENLVVSAANGHDPDCVNDAPQSLDVHHDGTVQTSDGLDLSLTADTCCTDPGTARTDRLRATWSVDLILVPPCTKIGTPAGETLDGTQGDDVICGMGGNDTLSGLRGNDIIIGGDQVDVIDGGPGNDLIHGLGGNDTLEGGPDADTIFGERGCDTLNGRSGPDTIFGGSGGTPPGPTDVCDTIDGGSGDDFLFGEGDVDAIEGGPGNDTVVGGPGSDFLNDVRGPNALLDGGPGNDNICGSSQHDVISGGPDDDKISAGLGQDSVTGGPGNDQIDGNASFAQLPNGDLCLADLGTDGRDVIHGGAGDDLLRGDSGNDLLTGDAGSDKLLGEAGADTLVGGTRKDVLNGGPDNDILKACDGVNDVLIGGPGSADAARADPVDTVHADVEIVTHC